MSQRDSTNGANGNGHVGDREPGSMHGVNDDIEVRQQAADVDLVPDDARLENEAEDSKKRMGPAETVIQLMAERVSIAKRWRRTGTVKVHRKVRENEVLVEEALASHDASVERRTVGTVFQQMPRVRVEGDTLVIPVVEEVIVTRREYLLKEEVRITTQRTSSIHREKVRTREHYIEIEREGSSGEPAMSTLKPSPYVANKLPEEERYGWLMLWPWSYWMQGRRR